METRNAGVTPVVSSNGTTAGGAVVWAIKAPPRRIDGTGTVALYAFDGANLAHTLYTAQGGVWICNGNTGGVMVTPLVANGRLEFRPAVANRVRMRIDRFVSFAFICAAACTAPAFAVGAGAAVGAAAPAIALTTLDGAPLPSAVAPGKVTVLNFWATWCPPCRAETPDMVAAYAKLHAEGVAFLGIDTTETAPIVKTFLSAKNVPYPVALGGANAYNAFGISYIPTTIVVDAAGVVRARWIGGVTPAQLAHYVSDARAGRTSVYITPAQRKIDALLAPAQYRFDGAGDAAVKAAQHAIVQAEEIAAKDDARVDYDRTQHAEGVLLLAAGNASRARATTDAKKVEALRLVATGSGKLNRWADAAQAYRNALAIQPDSPQLVAALSRAFYRLHDYDGMIAQARKYTQLKPEDGDGWSDLGLAYQRLRRFHDAVPAYQKSLDLLKADAARKPTEDALADVADTSLDAANIYVSLGDGAGARRTFAQANAYADRLSPKGEYATLKRNVKERTQEGLVAVALAGGAAKPVVSVMPWTGPDLPGSLASTLKYRLIVAAPPDASVTLHARGLRPEWVASFCADGLCSPQSVSFKAPASGVKTYEFQLVPPHDGDKPGSVEIGIDGGAVVPVPAAVRTVGIASGR